MASTASNQATLVLASVQEWLQAAQDEGLSIDFVDELGKGDMILG